MINQHFYIARLIARYLSDEIGEEEHFYFSEAT